MDDLFGKPVDRRILLGARSVGETLDIPAYSAAMVPLVDACGGGVNSFAKLLGMYERSIRPDAILFADTGGEKPDTYKSLERLSGWCETHKFPIVTIVRNDGMYASLEDNCLSKRMLPSLAYGFKSCSHKYKIRPQEKWIRHWQPAIDAWAERKLVWRAIGFDVDERRRMRPPDEGKFAYWYPLIEWGWDRADCIAAIKRHGLSVPVKSACFFCPASKKREIVWLNEKHPDLFRRAVSMEQNADLTSVKGLGRSWSWGTFIRSDDKSTFLDLLEAPCICSDGEEE